jgi:hypothetical protein
MELQLQIGIPQPLADIDIIEPDYEIITLPPKTPHLRPSSPPPHPIPPLQLPAPWYEPFPGHIVGGALAAAFVMELAANIFS